jgi:hypothetical protein
LSTGEWKVVVGKEGRVRMGRAKVDIGGNFKNKGNVKLQDTDFIVKKDVINEGDFLVNDPEKIKEALLEITRTAKDVTEIGKMVCEKIFGKSP